MTSRERMKIALTGGVPDRVPCAPDMSVMIPCRLTGKPFHEVLLYSNPPLWKAYIDAVRYFNFDAWFTYGAIDFKTKTEYTTKSYVEEDSENRKIHCISYDTPKGLLSTKIIYPHADADTPIEKLIKNFKEDFPKFKYLYPKITGYDKSQLIEQTKALGELGLMAVCLFPPGLQIFVQHFEGSLEAATYAYYDYPELFEELVALHIEDMNAKLDIILECKPDSILTGGSGSITLQSPDLWRELSLPSIKEITKKCKQAGVISGIHSCGKEEYIVKTCSEETDLDYINPLEIAPMGDCNLADIKKKYGAKISLMGNLHTTNTMLQGTVKDVRRESLMALRNAGVGGGFVLSTGDQCGRDTPDENIREMVRICNEFGTYPLNIEAINNELKAL